MRVFRLRAIRSAVLLLVPVIGGNAVAQGPPPNKLPVEKTRPLAEVAAGDQNFSPYTPAHPYSELMPGVLSRTVFEAAGPAGYRVEVSDLRVSAGRRGEDLKLPGAAFFEVRSGSGAILVGGKRQELQGGSTAAVSEGQAFTLDCAAGQPLTIRAYLVRGQ
jgi:hypothetical protein